MSKDQQQSNLFIALKDIFAGSVGGVFQCLVGHPLDTIKVRLQTQPTSVPLKYNGTIDCFKKIVAEEGFAGLYKGVQSPLVGMALMNSVLFLSYGQSKAFLQNDTNEVLSIPKIFLAGAMVGFTVSFVESPVDFFKSQLQVQYGGQQKYSGFIDCATKIAKSHGVRGVYQGLSATFIRDIPANSLYFGSYEIARRAFLKTGQKLEDLEAWKVLISGGIGGIMYWLLTYPTDVIKSTMQTDSTIISERKYKGWIDCATKIYHAEGTRGFFKGVAPCLLRSFPANAVCFLGYEQAKKLL